MEKEAVTSFAIVAVYIDTYPLDEYIDYLSILPSIPYFL